MREGESGRHLDGARGGVDRGILWEHLVTHSTGGALDRGGWWRVGGQGQGWMVS